ncbi:tetratricopeptide repeat protein [Micromonospora sp. NBC_01699]|uniref:BTAD domain-containing putative transcriptional regulator n=1 Tax=Micromonospora sp. NBC_01699 TaxID=2975984 RepID=UPI002E2D8F78|nr:BTAD domain-containing putative transcriptional regulator [Micromonospora sp. NBC_01699]
MTDDKGMSDLTRMLRQLRRREARGRGGAELTYRELATRTGWSLGIIAQYFSGKSLPPVDRFDVLVRLLGASPAELGVLATARDRADDHRRGPTPAAGGATPHRADVRLLGPVEVVGPGGRAALVGVRQRALIGLLALEAGRVVTKTRLVDALWGEAPPRTAIESLYSHVARVRSSLDACGLPGLLMTRASGYVLAARPDEVDVTRFAKLAAQARPALADGRTADAAAGLRDALALWRGDALADAQPAGWGAAEVDRLHEMWLSAQEDLLDARLRLGEHVLAVDELERLLVTRPARERLVELLMVALYRGGRHNEAVEAYQRLRGHLAEQLGVEPGPRAAHVYTAVLRRSPELDLDSGVAARRGISRPAQLPSRVGHFVGRDGELAVLGGLLKGSAKAGRLGVVCGPAGMGKTALAVQWAHRVAGRFPDGQLYLDLRGHDPATAMPVAEALAHLLRGLDVPSDQIPADLAKLVGLYRSALHDRRVLILLDNAAAADQVTSLVPPSGGSLLLATSRNQLAGLAVDYAVISVDVDVLSAGEALTLLSRVLGVDRVDREQAAASKLIDLCGRMPLALRIAAAKLATRPPRPIAELTADLAGADRLATLAVPGDSRSIRTVFASAYQALSPAAACLFRRMGLHPGATFTLALAAAVVGASVVQARSALDELAGVHLLIDMGAGRYRFHDLIRLYAGEQAESNEDEVSRIIDWHLIVADAANRVFDPARDRAGPLSVHPPIEAPFPADHDSALAFLDEERANLLPVVRHAGEQGHDRAVWQLAYLLTSFNLVRGHRADQVEMCRFGLAAAQRLDDPTAEALMRSLLGMACNGTQRYAEALEHLQHALALTRTVGDKRGQGMALNNIAMAYGRLGRLDAAADAFGEALALHTADSHPPGIALALNNLGHIYTLMGRPELALEPLSQALALAREIGHSPLEASALHSLGEVHLAEAEHDNALDCFTKVLTIRRRIGERRREAETLNLIGLTLQGRGDHAAATGHFRQALALSVELGDRHLEAATLAHLRDDQPAEGVSRA